MDLSERQRLELEDTERRHVQAEQDAKDRAERQGAFMPAVYV